jgi:hypothetical protein
VQSDLLRTGGRLAQGREVDGLAAPNRHGPSSSPAGPWALLTSHGPAPGAVTWLCNQAEPLPVHEAPRQGLPTFFDGRGASFATPRGARALTPPRVGVPSPCRVTSAEAARAFTLGASARPFDDAVHLPS